MGLIKPKIVAELMDVANRFADREDAYHNKRTRSAEDDRSHRYSNQRRRSRNYDTRTAKIKEMIAETAATTTTAKTICVTTGDSGQGTQEITTNHPTTCSTDHVICITLISTGRESQTMQ
jgi:hypothetical protein